jgi:hypothetical protein
MGKSHIGEKQRESKNKNQVKTNGLQNSNEHCTKREARDKNEISIGRKVSQSDRSCGHSLL